MISNYLKTIKDNVSNTSYSTWFAPIVPVQYEKNTFLLQVPNSFFVEYIEEKYIDLLRTTIHREVGTDTHLEYCVAEVQEKKNAQTLTATKCSIQKVDHLNGTQNQKITKLPDIDSQLHTSYNFDNFVEGESNQLARTAGISIAKEPGKTAFNPLFVYGQSGVGKTHLANAIGNMAKQLHPKKRVLYLSANTFQIQYTEAVRHNTVNDFLNFYQSIDLLLVDDIHEFAGKTATQNTFFHIFNYLHQQGKQIVLTSDRAPIVLVSLEQRLLTRFKWGLSAEINKPNEEMRKSILNNKILRDGIDIPQEVVHYIAEHVTDNVRDLEGVLISILAHSTLTNATIDIALAEKIISRIVSITKKTYTIEKIRDVVCEYYALSTDAILTKSRKREVVQARQIAMYLSKQLTNSSLARIGQVIGKRDHTTVMHACKIAGEMMYLDKHFKSDVHAIEEKLKN